MHLKVMYILEPTDSWRVFKASPKPPQKHDHNDQLMWEKWPRVGERPRPLLDYAVLPDNVKSFRTIYLANTDTFTDIYE